MQLIQGTRRRPLARMLALAALLCVASLQLQEAGHGHGLDLHDSYAECLLCKGSGPDAILDNIATSVAPAALRPQAHAVATSPRLTAIQSFLARGPPAHS